MAISSKKRLEVANVCYANVSGMFATFCNSKYRGPNFKWSNFSEMMVRDSETWMHIHNVRGSKQEINALAKEFAKEIADHLISEAGY